MGISFRHYRPFVSFFSFPLSFSQTFLLLRCYVFLCCHAEPSGISSRANIINMHIRKKRGTVCSTSLVLGSGKPTINDIDTTCPRWTREPLIPYLVIVFEIYQISDHKTEVFVSTAHALDTLPTIRAHSRSILVRKFRLTIISFVLIVIIFVIVEFLSNLYCIYWVLLPYGIVISDLEILILTGGVRGGPGLHNDISPWIGLPPTQVRIKPIMNKAVMARLIISYLVNN